MHRSGALLLAASVALFGCAPEIVLGDSENALPAPSSAGMSASAGASSTAGTSGAAGTAPVVTPEPSDDLPRPGQLTWSTDHEGGDISDWEEGDTFYGGEFDWGDISFSVDEGAGRNDSQGLAITIDTSFRGETSQGVRVYRRIEDAPAFYTAWFKLEEAHTVSDWWAIALFHARDESLDLENDVSLWDVRIVDTPDGGMALQFFDTDAMKGTTADELGRIEPGRWFELSVYLDYQPREASRMAILLDGVVLSDVKGLHTTRETNVFWAIGNGANGLEPTESTLYVDDASIRLAAGAP